MSKEGVNAFCRWHGEIRHAAQHIASPRPPNIILRRRTQAYPYAAAAKTAKRTMDERHASKRPGSVQQQEIFMT